MVDDPLASTTLPHVTIVAALVSPATHALAAELRRDSLRVEVDSADVLRAPARPIVYVFWLDAALGLALAPGLVSWALEHDVRAGLVGLIDGGGGAEREALLAAGFDDVVAGAPSARELSGRIRAVHRRLSWGGAHHGRLRHGELTLDVHDHALWIDGRTLSLTSIELAVMRELFTARGRPLSRAQLLDAAWGDGELEISERAVDNVILRLRRKLPRPDAIETVRSVGFRLAARFRA